MFPFRSKNKAIYRPLTPEQDAFLSSCTAEYNDKLEMLNRDWGFANYKHWGFDQSSGVFQLVLGDGSRVEADGQAIGSYFSAKDSWEWAWNNPHVEEPLKRDVLLVRAWGKREGIESLTNGMVPVPDKKFPMYLSAIALKVTGSQGVFAGSAGPLQVYIALKNLRRKTA